MNLFKTIKSKLSLEIAISLALLVFSVWFNLKLYRLEPTAKIDPNDNTFQFALIDRTNTIWDWANKKCRGFTFGFCQLNYLTDHWVHNWAQGYNLPFYYSHVPQIVIVGSYRFFYWIIGLFGYSFISLFAYYHLIIYLLLSLFPLSLFIALRVIRLPWIIAGVGAVLSTHISTDGLYGLDPPSFLWRGYGLSSQLFSMIWLPLSLAFSFRYLANTYNNQLKSIGNEFFKQLKTCFPFIDNLGRITKFSLIASRALQSNEPNNGQMSKKDQQNDLKRLSRAADQENFGYPEVKFFWLAVTFTVFTTMGHLGIGVMALLSAAVFALTPPLIKFLNKETVQSIYESTVTSIIKLFFLGSTVIFFLSYWIIPVLLYNNYHNISVWDPIWKFNSYGWKEVMIRFFNGDLFDWGRAPWYTMLALLGVFVAALYNRKQEIPLRPSGFEGQAKIMNQGEKLVNNSPQLSTINYQLSTYPFFSFALLFFFWLVMYFGRTTWGGLIDLIPGMSEFHISRFLVGLHAVGMFSAAFGIWGISRVLSFYIYKFISTNKKITVNDTPNWLFWGATLVILFIAARPIYKQTIYYNELNDKLIVQGNQNFDRDNPEVEKLFSEIRSLPPARVFAGRGGGWGKDFRLAETQMFMHLSTYGVPTALWLPETWSPNSDTEQYFSEDVAKDYDMYNLRWIAAPPGIKPQPFWKEFKRSASWILYEAPSSGYFTVGTRNMTVVSKKTDLINIIRLWIQSPVPSQKLYPEITFKKPAKPFDSPVPIIEMTDEASYKNLKSTTGIQNIWAQNPIYAGEPPSLSLVGPEEVNGDMIFKTKVNVRQGCKECLVILKQTFHPNWQATIDGKPAKAIIVFPFHIGVPISETGDHDIVLSYKPHPAKLPLIILSLLTVLLLIFSSNPKLINKILKRTK